jgi:membrane associated rhomboid family serine protease
MNKTYVMFGLLMALFGVVALINYYVVHGQTIWTPSAPIVAAIIAILGVVGAYWGSKQPEVE